jgi:adenylate kinase
VFRAARTLKPCELSPALSEALEFMRVGALVPDATVLDVVRERSRCFHCGGGFLLDGFPRTLAQAEALDELFDAEGVRLDAVLSYDLAIEKIVSRISGRRTCDQCKAVYHVEARPPRTEGACDHCGSRLVQREDDRPEAVRVRMQAYATSTAPLAEFYRRKGMLITIEAEGTPEEIFDRTMQALAGR